MPPGRPNRRRGRPRSTLTRRGENLVRALQDRRVRTRVGRSRRSSTRENRIRRKLREEFGFHDSEIKPFHVKRIKYFEGEAALRDSFRACEACHSWNKSFSDPSNDVCEQCMKKPKFADIHGTLPMLHVDEIFQSMSFAEKLLIAQAQPLMNVVFLPRGGQLALRKHSITFSKTDMRDFAKILPRLPEDIDTLIVARRSDRGELPEFRVRRHVVEKALRLLTELQSDDPAKPYYDILIDEDRLSELPEDASIIDRLTVIEGFDCDLPTEAPPDHHAEDISDSTSHQDLQNAEDFTRVFESFILQEDDPRTEIQALQDCIRMRDFHLDTTTAVNERSDYFFSRCYPHLFPDTEGDFRNPRFNPGELLFIPFRQWVGHLLTFEDGRFNEDRLFKFQCYNIKMRELALGLVTSFCTPENLLSDLTVGELLTAVQNGDTSVIRRLHRYSRSLEGTPQFKYGKRRDLMAMVQTLGLPKYFVTLSAADRDWPVVQENPRASNSDRNRYINKHSSKIIYMFKKKANLLFSEFKEELNITDHFTMFEFQSRGSIHLHALWWADTDDNHTGGVPYHDKIERIYQAFRDGEHESDENVQLMDSLETEFRAVCTATNPFFNQRGRSIGHLDVHAASHPSSYMAHEIKHDPEGDLGCLLKRFQRHSKCSSSCLRKRGGVWQCRYGFEKRLRYNTQKALYYDDDGNVVYEPVRNDSLMNTYNPDMIRLHRANLDFRPVTGMRAVLQYITKYICKAEVPSEMFKTLKKLSANHRNPLEDTDRGVRLLQRYIMRDIARDVSAQEVDLYFMGHSLCESSRAFCYATINPQKRAIHMVNGRPKLKISEWSYYLRRPAFFRHLSFVQMLQHYKLNSEGEWIQRYRSDSQKRTIVVFLPERRNPLKDLYWKVRCLGCIPCTSVTRCLNGHNTWLSRARAAFQTGNSMKIYDREIDPFLVLQQYEERERETTTTEDLPSRTDFRIPDNARRVLTHLDLEEDDVIYDVDMDLPDNCFLNKAEETTRMYRTYQLPPNPNSIATSLHEKEAFAPLLGQNSYDSLNPKQNEVVKFAVGALQEKHNESLIVHGVGGTGKSYVVSTILRWARENIQTFGVRSVLVAAPSGQAASLLPTGRTLHSALRIQVPLSRFGPLHPDDRNKLQEQFEKSLKLLIIDEFSMVGSRLLKCVEERLKEIFPSRRHLPMAGLPVIYMGDVGQLPPPGDVAIFRPHFKDDSQQVFDGKEIFRKVKYGIELTEVRRTGDLELVDALGRIRGNKTTRDDITYFKDRFFDAVTPVERCSFRNAVTICGTNKEVDGINSRRLMSLEGGLVRLRSRDVGRWVEEDTRHIDSLVELKVGAPVMLLANKNVPACLCNGSQGVVKGFTFAENEDPVVWVDFPRYRGEEIVPGHPTLVPITHHQFKTHRKGREVSRFQTPLRLAYAITAHKSQGMTLDKFVYRPGDREIAFGMSYVALSRCSSKRAFLIDYPMFGDDRLLERFLEMGGKTGKEYVNKAERRIRKIYPRTKTFIISLGIHL